MQGIWVRATLAMYALSFSLSLSLMQKKPIARSITALLGTVVKFRTEIMFIPVSRVNGHGQQSHFACTSRREMLALLDIFLSSK